MGEQGAGAKPIVQQRASAQVFPRIGKVHLNSLTAPLGRRERSVAESRRSAAGICPANNIAHDIAGSKPEASEMSHPRSEAAIPRNSRRRVSSS
jgi:hypothetical protein